MGNDSINNWVANAKTANTTTQGSNGVKVIRREVARTKGAIIMEVADKIWPHLMKMFEGVRDSNGFLLQPAHVRGIALNVAQDIVNEESKNGAN